MFPTCLLLAGDRDTGVRTANTNGVLGLDPETVSLALHKTGNVSVVVADRLEGYPVSLALFLVLHDEASDFTSACAVGPFPCQPHLCLFCISVVQVFWWARRI